MLPETKEVKSSQPTVKQHTLNPEELLDTKDLMHFLKISHRKTIYKLIDRGLPKIVVGHEYRFIKDEVLSFLRTTSEGRRAKKDR